MSSIPPVGPSSYTSGLPDSPKNNLFFYTAQTAQDYFNYLEQLNQDAPQTSGLIQNIFTLRDPRNNQTLYQEAAGGNFQRVADTLNHQPASSPLFQQLPAFTYTPGITNSLFKYLDTVRLDPHTHPAVKSDIDTFFDTPLDPNNPSATFGSEYYNGFNQSLTDSLNQLNPILPTAAQI